MNNVLTESVIKPEEQISKPEEQISKPEEQISKPEEQLSIEQLKPSDYFPGQELELLKARMKREVKAFSHNELARQYVDLYTTLIVLNKDYMALQKVLKDVKQLENLLEEAKKHVTDQEIAKSTQDSQNA